MKIFFFLPSDTPQSEIMGPPTSVLLRLFIVYLQREREERKRETYTAICHTQREQNKRETDTVICHTQREQNKRETDVGKLFLLNFHFFPKIVQLLFLAYTDVHEKKIFLPTDTPQSEMMRPPTSVLLRLFIVYLQREREREREREERKESKREKDRRKRGERARARARAVFCSDLPALMTE